MKDMKFISGFAVFGFVLSFVSSLFSPHSSFLHKLLMALLFAVIFGALGFGIKVVYKIFLSDSDGDLSSDFTPVASPAGSAAAPKKGQLVDIVIQDEDISPGESENRFAVGENRQMLNDTDVRGSAASVTEPSAAEPVFPAMSVPNVTQMPASDEPPDSAADDKKPEFVPQGIPALTSSAPETGRDNCHESAAAQEKIDTLPDMSDFAFGNAEPSAAEDSEAAADNDSDVGVSYTSRKPEQGAGVQDAGLIAKAISTVLADENSM